MRERHRPHRTTLPLLEPSRIGVSLSEEYQLAPEQSTSAVICHHPAAKYFNVTVTDPGG
jgi:cobalamin-dependent methionine synthase I